MKSRNRHEALTQEITSNRSAAEGSRETHSNQGASESQGELALGFDQEGKGLTRAGIGGRYGISPERRVPSPHGATANPALPARLNITLARNIQALVSHVKDRIPRAFHASFIRANTRVSPCLKNATTFGITGGIWMGEGSEHS